MASHLTSYVPWLRHLSVTELESLLEDVQTIEEQFAHMLTSARTDLNRTKRTEVPPNARNNERLGENAPLEELLVELDRNTRGDPKLHLYSSHSVVFLAFLSVTDKTGRSHRIRLVTDDRSANVERLSKQKTTILFTALPLSFVEVKELLDIELQKQKQRALELQEAQTERYEAVAEQPRPARRREARRRSRRVQSAEDPPAIHVQIIAYAKDIMLEPLVYSIIFALLGLSMAYTWYTREPDMYLSTDSTRTIRDIAYWAPVGSTPERWYYVNAQKLFHKAVAIRERGIRLEAVGPKYGYIDNMADIIFDLVEILAYDSNPMHEPLMLAVHNLVPVVKVKCCPTKPLKYHGRDIEEDKKLAAFASPATTALLGRHVQYDGALHATLPADHGCGCAPRVHCLHLATREHHRVFHRSAGCARAARRLSAGGATGEFLEAHDAVCAATALERRTIARVAAAYIPALVPCL